MRPHRRSPALPLYIARCTPKITTGESGCFMIKATGFNCANGDRAVTSTIRIATIVAFSRIMTPVKTVAVSGGYYRIASTAAGNRSFSSRSVSSLNAQARPISTPIDPPPLSRGMASSRFCRRSEPVPGRGCGHTLGLHPAMLQIDARASEDGQSLCSARSATVRLSARWPNARWPNLSQAYDSLH